jgi:2-C-methyl-D-erythritol 2,4-cyclodiphosphate synthase
MGDLVRGESVVRIGQGIDIHRWSDDPRRTLRLGTVEISHSPGLDGHSDADAVTHALCDALLSAVNLGTIGQHFPDTDETWRGANSADLLTRVLSLVAAAGFVTESATVTVVAERPRLAPYFESMSAALSTLVGAPVSLSATTAEGLGSLGSGEGLAAVAVALVKEK